MSVPSELIMNTQNSFQTHAQRGANIVMRGGKKNRRTRKKRGGRPSPGSSFWRIYTETPVSYDLKRLTEGGYPKPKTKENINKLIDFCKKNVIYGRLKSCLHEVFPPDFEITQKHVTYLAPYYIHNWGTNGDGWSCDVCTRDDFPNRGRGYGDNDWEPEFPANYMAMACSGEWGICIDCIDKIDTLDKGTSKNFSIAELKKKGLDVTKLEEEAKANTENMVTDCNEKKKAAILSEYDTFEEQAEKECNNTDMTQYKNEIEDLRTKMMKIKKNCRKTMMKKHEKLASKWTKKVKLKTEVSKDPEVKIARETEKELQKQQLDFSDDTLFGAAPSAGGKSKRRFKKGGRKKRRRSRKKRRKSRKKRRKSRKKRKRTRRRKRRR